MPPCVSIHWRIITAAGILTLKIKAETITLNQKKLEE